MPDERDHVESDADDSTVLELFGVKLSVSNPRLAEVLKMDAREALAVGTRPSESGESRTNRAQEIREAVPDTLIFEKSAHSEAHARVRDELRTAADALAGGLGFDVSGDGTWSSPTGYSLRVRIISEDPTYASASDTVHKLESYHRKPSSADDGFLFVTQDQRSADIFKVAIRQGGFHDHAKTVSLDVLQRVRTLMGGDRLTHEDVVSLLLPVAGIDVASLVRLCETPHDRGETTDAT